MAVPDGLGGLAARSRLAAAGAARGLGARLRRRGPLLAFIAFGVFWGGWAALIPQLQTDVGASKGELGVALFFVAVGSVPAMLAAGWAYDRVGPRLVAWTLLGMAGAVVLPAAADGVLTLGLALVVVGVFTGSTDVAMNGAVAELEAQRESRLMQLAHALYAAGVLIGAVAVGIARELGLGRLPILAGLGAVLVAAALPNLAGERVRRASQSRRLRVSRAAIPLGLACMAAFVIEGGMENWGAVFLERDLGAGPGTAALAPAAYGAALMIGRLSAHRLEPRIGDTTLFSAATGVAVVGLVAAALAPNPPLAIAAFFVGGAGISVAAPALFGAGGRNASSSERGSAVATVTTLGYLGFLVGPPVVGGLAEIAGLRVSFAALALLAAALLVVARRLRL